MLPLGAPVLLWSDFPKLPPNILLFLYLNALSSALPSKYLVYLQDIVPKPHFLTCSYTVLSGYIRAHRLSVGLNLYRLRSFTAELSSPLTVWWPVLGSHLIYFCCMKDEEEREHGLTDDSVPGLREIWPLCSPFSSLHNSRKFPSPQVSRNVHALCMKRLCPTP